jgi:hypothetical protein
VQSEALCGSRAQAKTACSFQERWHYRWQRENMSCYFETNKAKAKYE